MTGTCSNIDKLEIAASGQTRIPGDPLGELLGAVQIVGFQGMDISQSQEFENQGYTKDQIDSVRVKSFTLEVTAPEEGNFDFLSSLSFSVESEGLPPMEIARLDPVPEGSNVLQLEILDVDLRDYATAERMSVTTSARGNAPREDTTIEAQLYFDVDVNVSGSVGCSVSRQFSAVR